MSKLNSTPTKSSNETILPKNDKARSWADLQKHHRFVSDWDVDNVVINVAHSAENTHDLKTYDLRSMRLAKLGHVSADGSEHLWLCDYPDFLASLKGALNALLFSRTEALDEGIVGLINHSLKLFSWLIKENIFKMSQVQPHDMRQLKDAWKSHGWWGVLECDLILESVLTIAQNDGSLKAKLSGTGNTRKFTVNIATINRMTGLPFSANFLPVKFVHNLAAVTGGATPALDRKGRSLKMTATSFSRLMIETNRFAAFPQEFGALSFVPFLDANKTADKEFPAPKSRTPNISIDNINKIVSTALQWITEYFPLIVHLSNIARTAITQIRDTRRSNEERVRNAVADAYAAWILEGKISIPGISGMTLVLLSKCIDTLQAACMCLIAINHGRRRNEILGDGVPYGLYFGCLRELNAEYNDWRIDIYIEKSARAYLSFWCNDIVRLAIGCLEDIYQIFRPLGSDLLTPRSNLKDARQDKLFSSRTFSKNGFDTDPIGFEFGRKSKMFFEYAGVDGSYFNERTHPFRRIFACLYIYRYDMPNPSSLTYHMDHDRGSVTEVYYTDSTDTPPSVGVKAMYGKGYGKDLASLNKIIDEVRSTYFQEVILRLLNGELIGGNFAKLVLKLMSRLSGSIKFQELSRSSMAAVVTQTLEKRGYSISPFEHGACCATDTSRGKSRSNCYENEKIHPEKAGPKMCSGCAHSLTPERYREGLRLALSELTKQSSDFSRSPAERFQIRKDAEQLEAYIDADEKIAHENQAVVSNLTFKWNKIFFAKEH